MGFTTIQKYPLVRILIPLLGGIFMGEKHILSEQDSFYIIGFLVLLFLMLILVHKYVYSYKWRWTFGALLFLFTYTLGYYLVGQKACSEISPSDNPEFFYGQIIDDPILKENVIEYKVRLHTEQKNCILLYTPRDSTFTYHCDEVIAFRGTISSSNKEIKQPYEFDYNKYLKRRGISGVLFTQKSNLKSLGQAENKSLFRWLALQRKKIYTQYLSYGFSENTLGLISALTIGIKEDLSLDLKEAFSSAGVSHVLALSGLHIGLIFYMINSLLLILFHPFKKRRRGYALSVSLLFIWIFALFVGASASVVRSVLLFSLMGLSMLSNKRGNSLNSLAFVAIIMLVVNPYWLFDIGFILSFSAVSSILIFSKPCLNLYQPKTKIGRYVWGLIVMSFVAQLGTAPWIVYFFGSFPTYFLVANIVVIPLITLLLYLLIVFLIFLPFSSVALFLKYPVAFLADFINLNVSWLSKIPYASINDIVLYPLEIITIYLVLYSFYYVLTKSRAVFLYSFMISIVLFLCVRLFFILLNAPSNSMKLYCNNNKPFIECGREDGSLWVVTSDTILNSNAIYRKNKRRWLYNQYKNIYLLQDSSENDALFWDNCILYYKGRSLMFTQKNMRAEVPLPKNSRLHIDYLYWDTYSYVDIGKLYNTFDFSTILLSNSLQEKRKNEIIEFCRANKLTFITLDPKGCIDLL